MDQSFSISTLALLLLAQGAGGLFLALSLVTLYAYRRQPHLLYWTLAWVCNGLWLLLGSPRVRVAGGSVHPLFPEYPWLLYPAYLFGLWHAAFWVLSLSYFRDQPDEPGHPAPADPPLFPPLHAIVLLAVGAVAIAIVRQLSLCEQHLVLGVTLAGVYSLSVLVLLRHWRKVRRWPALALAVLLALYAADRLHYAGLCRVVPPDQQHNHSYAQVAALIDCFIQIFLAIAMFIFLLDTEQGELGAAIQRLEESEERFRLIFEHSGVGMTLLTKDGRFLQVNPALLRMLGFSVQELRGRRLGDLIYHQDATLETRGVSEAETPLMYEREKRYVRKDGESISARVLRVPVRDTSGRTHHYVGVLVDITERRRAEDALAASEKRYRLLNQVAPDGIHVTSRTGDFVDVNPAFCQMLGYHRDDLLRLSLGGVAADPEAIRRHLERVVRHNGDRLETKLLSRGGLTVDVEMSGVPLELEGHLVLYGICRNISERKRAEAALRDVQVRLREERDFNTQIFETADVLICVVDPQGRIVRFNNTCVKVSGYSEDEVRGKVFWDILLPERSVEAVAEGHKKIVGGSAHGIQQHALLPRAQDSNPDSPLVYEIVWRTRSGEERLIAWRNSTVHDAQSEVRYVISTGIDVTEQRRLEEQLRQARKMETFGTLVGGIAHDFNNQLTAILGHLHLVQEDLTELGGDRRLPEARGLGDKLGQAERAAQRCADITQRLLTFSRGRVGSSRSVSVDSLLAEAEKTLAREFPPSIRVVLRKDVETWPVVGDATQLQQVLLNLAANARDAMPHGGSLTLAAGNCSLEEGDCLYNLEARPGRFVELSVTDTGSGMTPEVQAHLFEPFFTTKTMGQGAGMGLAMAYGIVKAHKGWITVQSVPSEGSTFRIYLPASEVVVPVRVERDNGVVEGGAECILVVDDEDLVRGLVQAVLERWGFRVLTACDGEEGLTVYRQHQAEIDLVLLDYSMPKLTGLQAFQHMRVLDPQVCVVFSSGYTMDSDCDQLLATGAKAFIPKPYRPDDLIRVIRHVLDDKASSVASPLRS